MFNLIPLNKFNVIFFLSTLRSIMLLNKLIFMRSISCAAIIQNFEVAKSLIKKFNYIECKHINEIKVV